MDPEKKDKLREALQELIKDRVDAVTNECRLRKAFRRSFDQFTVIHIVEDTETMANDIVHLLEDEEII